MYASGFVNFRAVGKLEILTAISLPFPSNSKTIRVPVLFRQDLPSEHNTIENAEMALIHNLKLNYNKNKNNVFNIGEQMFLDILQSLTLLKMQQWPYSYSIHSKPNYIHVTKHYLKNNIN